MTGTTAPTDTVLVEARRSGRWWAISLPDHPGVFSQARRLDQVEDCAREALALALDVPQPAVGPFELRVSPPGSIAAELAELQQANRTAEAAATSAAELRLEIVETLAADGFSLRDIGALVGLSHQRVSQLLAEARRR